MYLEPIQSFGNTGGVVCADGFKTNAARCSPQADIACNNRGGYNKGVAGCRPSIPPKPKFKTAYSLTGTPPSKDWFYPACNAGYTKQQVNKPHPQMYSCFDPAELAWNKKYGIMM